MGGLETYRSGRERDEDEYLMAEVLGCGEVLVTVVDGARSDRAVYLTVEDARGLCRWLGDVLRVERATDQLMAAIDAASKDLTEVFAYANNILGLNVENLPQITEDPKVTRAVLSWLRSQDPEPF